MSDQEAATEQPVDSPAEGTDSTPQVPAGYIPEKDYKEVQAWATRDAQKAAELERQQQDPEYQAQVAKQWLEAQGYEIPGEDDEEDSSVYEPDPRLRAELDELKQWRESLTTEQQQEQNYSSYRSDVDPQLTKLGVPEVFLESVADIAYNQLPAIQTPQGPKADLEGAVKQWEQVADMFADHATRVQQRSVESWRKGKKAPHTSPVGREGTRAPKLETTEDMTDAVLEYMADNA